MPKNADDVGEPDSGVNLVRFAVGTLVCLIGVALFVFTGGLVQKLGAVAAVIGLAIDAFMLTGGWFW